MIIETDEQRTLIKNYWDLYYQAQNLVDGCNPENGTLEGAAENQKKSDQAYAAAGAIADKLRSAGLVLSQNGIWGPPTLSRS